jgi:amidohydrolase
MQTGQNTQDQNKERRTRILELGVKLELNVPDAGSCRWACGGGPGQALNTRASSASIEVEMSMNARQLAEKHERYAITLRRDLHRYPEPSGEEERTSSLVAAELESIGVPYEIVGKYGIIATLEGSASKGSAIVLRADMDALPIQESDSNLARLKAVVSEVAGCAHLCGHDAHTAMLLGAAKGLSEVRCELAGDVLLCFEQAEETAEGIAPMMQALSTQDIKAVWGIHVYAGLPSGAISVEPGPRMSGMTSFRVTLKGRGGHGSRPDQTIDPILCAAQTVVGLCTIPARELDPADAGVLTIGMIRAGETPNVIPDTASFAGTARFFEPKVGQLIQTSFERIVTHTARAHRCEAHIEARGPHPAVINDPALATLAARSVQTALGPECLATCKPWMASESMGYYLSKYPGVFALLGVACDELGTGAAHHNPSFDIDESALKNGMAATLQFAQDVLSQPH